MKAISKFKAAFSLLFATALATSAIAAELPSGAAKISDAEQVAMMKDGKTINGIGYGKDGKPGAKVRVEWKKGGTKVVSVTPNGKKAITKTLKWQIKDGKFCDEAFANGKMSCGTQGLWFKKGGTCYVTTSDKKHISTEFGC